MKPSEVQFAKNLQALAVPQCRRIVEALIEQPQSSAELSKACKLTPGSIEKHLQILFEAGLVKLHKTNGVEKVHLQISKFNPTLDWFLKLDV